MSIRNWLRRFARDESASTTVEFVLVIPLLAWCFVGTYTFFDAYRVQTINLKAAYTLGDQLSRETNYITPNYLAGLFSLHDFLVDLDTPTAIRFTVYEYEADDDSYRVIWSRGQGRTNRVTDSAITDVKHRLPEMPDEEISIMTETWVDVSPDEFVGLNPFTAYEVVVTRPRFAGQLCWNSVENGTSTTAICQAGH